jgi:hypothetical protein
MDTKRRSLMKAAALATASSLVVSNKTLGLPILSEDEQAASNAPATSDGLTWYWLPCSSGSLRWPRDGDCR